MEIFIRNKLYRGPVRAVVLDWAGTAVDFGCMGPVSAFVEVFEREGVRITPAEAREPMGLKKIDHLRALCAMVGVAERWAAEKGNGPTEDDIQRMYSALEPLMAAGIRKYSEPVRGLLEAVSAWRSQSIRIGSTTGYTRPIMDAMCPEAARKGYRPDCVVTSSDVAHGRPCPFMCYRNAMELEIYPLEAMVKIGDTVTDIHEGLNAGMWTVGVTKSGNSLGLTPAQVDKLGEGELRERLSPIESRFRAEGAHFVVEDIGRCLDVVDEIGERLAAGERP
jgi:phosphonoacetaldehyde hydrolase